MKHLDSLFEQVAREEDVLRASTADRANARQRLMLLDLPVARASRGKLRLFVSIALASAVVALGGFIWRSQQPAALTATLGASQVAGVGTWVSTAPNEVVPLRFSDGTQIDVGEGSRARIVELAPLGAHLLLESGRASVHVKKAPHAAWRLSMGPFEVHVTGTQFDVAWHPEQDLFELDLREGSVELTGCGFGQGQRVSAGQSVRAACKSGQVSIVRRGASVGSGAQPGQSALLTPSPSAAPAAGSEQDSSSAPLARAPAVPGSALREQLEPRALPRGSASRAEDSSSYASLARAGKYQEAFAVAQADGFAAECARASANELLLLADAARYAHRPQESASALRSLRARFSRTNDAALAAFALGRLSFDALAAYSEAATWFQTYLKEQPSGSLAREARGRLMEAQSRAGSAAAARDTALRYLHDYPSGPHAELARRLTAP